jgi:hypothetical protein
MTAKADTNAISYGPEQGVLKSEIRGQEAVKKLGFASRLVEDLQSHWFVRGGEWLASRTSGWLRLGIGGLSGLSGRSC